MTIKVLNLTNEDIETDLVVVDNFFFANIASLIFTNENAECSPINEIHKIQGCSYLREYIEADKIVFVVNDIQATKQQSLNIMNPVINFP